MNQLNQKKIEDFKKLKKCKIIFLCNSNNINNYDLQISKIYDSKHHSYLYITGINHTKIIEVVKIFDGYIDFFFLDSEKKYFDKSIYELYKKNISKSNFYPFQPSHITTSCLNIFLEKNFNSICSKNILIIGFGKIGFNIWSILKNYNCKISVKTTRDKFEILKKVEQNFTYSTRKTQFFNAQKSNFFDLIILSSNGTQIFKKNDLNLLNKNSLIIDLGIGCIEEKTASELIQNQTKIYRPSIHKYLENWLDFFLKKTQITKTKNRIKIGEFNIIESGYLGLKNDIILNSLNDHSNIIGVCDGRGGLLNEKESKRIIKKFKSYDD